MDQVMKSESIKIYWS